MTIEEAEIKINQMFQDYLDGVTEPWQHYSYDVSERILKQLFPNISKWELNDSSRSSGPIYKLENDILSLFLSEQKNTKNILYYFGLSNIIGEILSTIEINDIYITDRYNSYKAEHPETRLIEGIELENRDSIEESDVEQILIDAVDAKPKLISFQNTLITPSNEFVILDYVDPVLFKLLVKDPTLLKTLDSRIFEKLLAEILLSFGYQVELLQGSKDGGVDIIGIKKDSTFGIHKYLVQTKRYTNKVEVEPVRLLHWAHREYNATKSCLATTSTFTKGAWKLANQYPWQIELKDYEEIVSWLKAAAKAKGIS